MGCFQYSERRTTFHWVHHHFLQRERNLTKKSSPFPGWKPVPNQTVHLSFFVTTRGGGHDDHIFPREGEGNDGNNSEGPGFARWGNALTTPLLRAGVKLTGPGNYPMYLLTVRERKSGQPRTVPIVLLEQNGRRYLAATYGSVNWVYNLLAAGEAILTRGRRAERVTARELSPEEAALVLQAEVGRTPLARAMAGRFYVVTVNAPLEQCERAMFTHPVFVLERNEHGSL